MAATTAASSRTAAARSPFSQRVFTLPGGAKQIGRGCRQSAFGGNALVVPLAVTAGRVVVAEYPVAAPVQDPSSILAGTIDLNELTRNGSGVAFQVGGYARWRASC